MHGCMVDLERYIETSGEQNLIQQIKVPIFLEAVLARDNGVPFQFGRESQPQHLKRWFFLKNQPIYFHINSASVIRPVNQVEFFAHWNQQATSRPSPWGLIDQIQVQKPILVVARIRCLITLRVESTIINTDSNITDNIIKKVINLL